ncbi:hypothetical protein OESDEN_03369 [Oesophagostomum dentatum]|uniref:Uncharacterized protein n=1 Tax=Oesophagostomum dentatum TaxID=61180 RepID=A0A0B1THG8_OESDE|nr:hypothetical protein OESDEN_03369 [Oesophagostomum dentatum]
MQCWLWILAIFALIIQGVEAIRRNFRNDRPDSLFRKMGLGDEKDTDKIAEKLHDYGYKDWHCGVDEIAASKLLSRFSVELMCSNKQTGKKETYVDP